MPGTPDEVVDTGDSGGGGGSSGGLTDAELRAAPVPVSATLNVGDIEIGAVELKDGTSNDRAAVSAAGALKVDGSAVTQPTNDVGLPNALGQAASAASTSVVIASDQSTVPVNDPGLADTVGQKTMAASAAVVIASDQSAVPVSGTVAATASGDRTVVGKAADGAAVAGNPVLIAGQDGTNAQSVLTDTTGRQIIAGGAADTAVAAGNPVRIAGRQFLGTTTRDFITDSSGALYVTPVGGNGQMPVSGAVGDGQAVGGAGNPVLMAGQDATNVQSLLTDTSGRMMVAGGAADGAAVAGNPVRVAGKDTSGNTQDVLTSTLGAAAVSAVSSQIFDPNAGESRTVKTANGVATASGDNVVLALVSSRKIRVLSYALQVQETGVQVVARFQDNGTATNRTMPWWLTASADGTSQQGVVRNPGGGEHFYFETGSGVGLDLNLSAAIDVGYELTYIEVV